MKDNSPSDRFKLMAVIKITVFFFVCLPLIYLCNRYSFSFQQLSYFILPPKLSFQTEVSSPISTNFSYLVSAPTLPVPPPATLRARHSVAPFERTGIIDENGVMSEEFEVGWFDMDAEEDSGDLQANEKRDSAEKKAPLKIEKYEVCGSSMTNYIPCFDDTDRRETRYKQQCPEKQKGLDCLLPLPQGYKIPITWPQSRNEVWLKNVMAPFVNGAKEDYTWFSIEKDKLVFHGDGPNFTSGTDQYLDQIAKMVPDIEFGHRTRIGLDIGDGIASSGALLVQRNVSVLSIPSNNVNKHIVQLALERGLPSMVTSFATHRLLFPSQAFDFIHCATCGLNWTRGGGLLLLEINRVLRAGGYFIWAAEPVHKQQGELQNHLEDFMNLSSPICWELVSKEEHIAIWRKAVNNSCYLDRHNETWPPLCHHSDDPDDVWHVELGACFTQLPENGYGSNVTAWPQRVIDPPQRLQSIVMDAQTSRNELFMAESKYWNEIIESYIKAYRWKSFKLRNVMDMRAGFGGFAAALYDLGLDCWVMNVVPVSGFNTLPVIYDRGLIGVMHDWCEPFHTYPRTYDLLHAAGLFTIEQRRCNISTIMLEMDRILRPDGRVYIRDSIVVMDEIREVATAMRWVHALHDTGEGPHASWKILICEKRLLRV